MYFNSYMIDIEHPVTEEIVEARISFDFTKAHSGSFDEPPEYGGVEICEVYVFGENITNLFTEAQLTKLEDTLFAAEYDDSYDYEPDDEEF